MNIEALYKLYSKHYLVDTDTRNIRKNTIYFALKGANFNGNAFAEEALKKGAIYAVVDEENYAKSKNCILVTDVLKTLQALASYHRKQLSIPIIALTGSNGKTTTKELINAVLCKKYTTVATLGNLNNHIGVPLTLLSMRPNTEIGLIEMGANHPKEIAFLCEIAQPDYGYITNFGKAHIEGFGSLEGVIKAKSEMYDNLKKCHKTAFVNPNDPVQMERTKALNRVLLDCDNPQFVSANPFVIFNYKGVQVASQLIGKYNYNNMLAAIRMGQYFKVDDTAICEAISNYKPTNNRSQIIKTAQNTVILDAYNANPTSMKAALENFGAMEATNKIAIIGDMFELGAENTKEHQAIADLLANLSINSCYLVGKLFYKVNTKFQKFETVPELQEFLEKQPIKNSTLLIKGSRGMAMERLLETIQ